MAWTSKVAAAPPNPYSTYDQTAIQEFSNSNLTPEQSKQQAVPLLNSEGLLGTVRGLAPEDQAKFVDKVDQVRREGSFISSRVLPHYLCKGIPNSRLGKREIYNRPGEGVR